MFQFMLPDVSNDLPSLADSGSCHRNNHHHPVVENSTTGDDVVVRRNAGPLQHSPTTPWRPRAAAAATRVGAVPFSNLFCASKFFINTAVASLTAPPPPLAVKTPSLKAPMTKRRLHDSTHLDPFMRPLKHARRTLKRVRFQAFPTVHYPATGPRGHGGGGGGGGGGSTWLTLSELRGIKRSARLSCALIDIEHELHTSLGACRSRCSAAASGGATTGASAAAAPVPVPCSKLLSESSEFCRQRGLERWSSEAHYRARMIQLVAGKTNFFIEQSVQLLQGRRDDDKLADICRNTSRVATQFALLLGQADLAVAEYAQGSAC